MHLGDADALGDLALGQVLNEAKVEDLAIPLRDLLEDGADRLAVLDGVEREVLRPDPVAQRTRLVPIAHRGGRVE